MSWLFAKRLRSFVLLAGAAGVGSIAMAGDWLLYYRPRWEYKSAPDADSSVYRFDLRTQRGSELIPLTGPGSGLAIQPSAPGTGAGAQRPKILER